jgi:hypothetical protein
LSTVGAGAVETGAPPRTVAAGGNVVVVLDVVVLDVVVLVVNVVVVGVRGS